MTGLTIRPAEVGDLDALMRIEADVFGPNAWSREQFADELDQLGQTRWYAVADADADADADSDADTHAAGGVSGYVGLYLSPPDADVQTIAVAAGRQGTGIGRLLLNAAVEQAWALGCTRMFLEVRADNEAALALYAAAGFQRLGRRPRYYPDGTDAATMRLRRHEPAALESGPHD